jgi:hypothetical protein
MRNRLIAALLIAAFTAGTLGLGALPAASAAPAPRLVDPGIARHNMVKPAYVSLCYYVLEPVWVSDRWVFVPTKRCINHIAP